MSQGDELNLQRCAATNTGREQGNESEQNLIMQPDGMAVVPENPQSFSTVHGFERGQAPLQVTLQPNAVRVQRQSGL